MSLRDIAFTIIFAGLVPASFRRPWVGVLAWSWIAYMAPHKLTWGFAASLPVAQGIAVATLAGFLFSKDKPKLPRTIEATMLAVLAIDFTMTTIFSLHPEYAWGKWNWVMKSLLMTFVTMYLMQDREKLRYL